MTISTETKTSRNLIDICGIGNEKTVLSYKALADWSIILAETIVVMQDAVRAYEKVLQDAEVKLPSILGSILPDYLNQKNKVVVDVEEIADAPDPLVHGFPPQKPDTVELDLEQFIEICGNTPPLCWSHFVGKTDSAMLTSSPPTASLNDLAYGLEEVSSEATAAVRAYIEKNCPKNWEVKFSRLVEQDFTIIVQAATEQEAKDEVLRYGVNASHSCLPDWDEEREYEECSHIESIEETDEEI
jgi:hypothetical protein